MTSSSGPVFAALTAMAQRGSGFSGYGGFNNQTVVDKAPPEIHHMIDPYWYQFPPMNPLWYGILGFVIGCLGCVSVIGNGMVVYIFASTKSLRTPSNLLVINLAFSDFCMMFTMSPPMVMQCPTHKFSYICLI
jgi:r-opsin